MVSGKGMFVGQYGEESQQYRQFSGEDVRYTAEQPGYGQLTAGPAYQGYPYAADSYPSASGPSAYGYPPASGKSRLAAGLLAVFLGSLGVHNFYLGRAGRAVLQLLLSLLSLGLLAPLVGIWALVEGILILVASPGYTVDGKGAPLRD